MFLNITNEKMEELYTHIIKLKPLIIIYFISPDINIIIEIILEGNIIYSLLLEIYPDICIGDLEIELTFYGNKNNILCLYDIITYD